MRLQTGKRTDIEESAVTWKRGSEEWEGELSLHQEERKYIVKKRHLS